VFWYGLYSAVSCGLSSPIRRSGTFIQGKTTSNIVMPDDFESEPDAKLAAEKMIRKL
jgi:hypothetical protein